MGQHDDNIIEFGTTGENFYIILTGSVDVMIPNSNIPGWRHRREEFLNNCAWKEEMDKKYVSKKLRNDMRSKMSVRMTNAFSINALTPQDSRRTMVM